MTGQGSRSASRAVIMSVVLTLSAWSASLIFASQAASAQDAPAGTAAQAVHVTLKVIGIDCGDCPYKVERAINTVAAVTNVRLRPGHRPGELFAQVTFAGDPALARHIVQAIIAETGYKVEVTEGP